MIRVKFGNVYPFDPPQVQKFMVAVIDSFSVSIASLISNMVLAFLVVDLIGLQFLVCCLWFPPVFCLFDSVCSPNNLSTLRSSYGRSKDRCVIRALRVLHLASGFLPLNSRMKLLLCDVHVHFDRAGSHTVCGTSFAWSWAW